MSSLCGAGVELRPKHAGQAPDTWTMFPAHRSYFLKNSNQSYEVVTDTFNPSTWEAKADRSL